MHFVVSANNELQHDILHLAQGRVHVLDTISGGRHGLVSNFYPVLRSIKTLCQRLEPLAVVSLMPHIWSPLIGRALRRAGWPYVSIIHDATAHPGDKFGLINRWLLQDIGPASLVVSLNPHVAESLGRSISGRKQAHVTLFHPDMGAARSQERPSDSQLPLRLLFFGRIMRYKGLSLGIDAIIAARKLGSTATLAVFGDGEISTDDRARLAAIGANVENRWIDDQEIAPILAQHDVMFCPHIEASQSGVVALAFGHGLPVIASPVGGIRYQISPGVDGLLAASVTADDLAAAILALDQDRPQLERMRQSLQGSSTERSSDRFLDRLLDAIKTLH